jgi:hypothetical protein
LPATRELSRRRLGGDRFGSALVALQSLTGRDLCHGAWSSPSPQSDDGNGFAVTSSIGDPWHVN